MEEKVIALAHRCRELLPIMDMVAVLEEAVGLPKDLTTIHVLIHEDNAGALVLTVTLPPQHIPQSKHSIDTIWFCEEKVKRGIKSEKIDIVEQVGDTFIKSLPRVSFEYVRSKLMGLLYSQCKFALERKC